MFVVQTAKRQQIKINLKIILITVLLNNQHAHVVERTRENTTDGEIELTVSFLLHTNVNTKFSFSKM